MSEDQLVPRHAALAVQLTGAAQLFQSDIQAAIDFAMDANAADRGDLTITLLRPLVARSGNIALLWQLLGLAYRAEQQSQDAYDAFSRAAALGPDDRRIAAGHATTALELGIPSTGLFRSAQRLDPENGELALSAAAALMAEGNGKAALSVLNKTVARAPDWDRGQHTLATVRWLQGEGPGAFDEGYRAAVATQPENVGLRLAWIRHTLQTQDFNAAETLLSDARTAIGPRIELDAIEAILAAEQGDTARAETAFARVSGFEDGSVNLYRIRHLLRLGRLDEAEALCDAMRAGPDAVAVFPYLSAIWRMTGNTQAVWLDGDPPLYCVFDLECAAEELAALAHVLRRLHRAKAELPGQSVRGGTQTDGNLLLRHEPEIQSTRATIARAVADYVSGLPEPVPHHPLLGMPRGQIRFAGSWSVRLAGGGHHVAHTHTHGWISSAMYVSLPDAAELGDAPAGWLELGAPPPDLGLDLAPYARIEPKPGRLVLFPSTMWHRTIPFGAGERLTIAFDVAVPGR